MQNQKYQPDTPSPVFSDSAVIVPDCVILQYNEYPERLADINMARQFLHEYTGSADTYNSYRREVERYLQFVWSVKKKTLKDSDRQFAHDYMAFIENLPKSWVGTAVNRRFITRAGKQEPNPSWRPFVSTKHLSNSIHAILAILSSFYTYMIEEAYLNINPVVMIRQKNRYIQKTNQHSHIRRLSAKQWTALITAVETSDEPAEESERALFLISCFFLLGARVSELSSDFGPKTMGSFYCDHEGQWWVKTVGKGNKLRDIPVNSDMLAALHRYREFRGLPREPEHGETTPLIENLRSKSRGLGSRMIRKIISEYYDKAIVLLSTTDAGESQRMSKATVHWLRHTSVSEQVKVRPQKHAQIDAGHNDSATTSKYNDIFDRERHESMESLKINWQAGR